MTDYIKVLEAALAEAAAKTGCASQTACHDWLEAHRKLKDLADSSKDNPAVQKELVAKWDQDADLYHLINQQMGSYDLLARAVAGDRLAAFCIPDVIAALEEEMN